MGSTGATGPTGPRGATGATGPTGPAGSSSSANLLSAYSVPTASGSDNQPLLFDRHSLSYGTGISHTPGSGDFVIQEPGVYVMSFQGNFSPARGTSFPRTLTLYLNVGGTKVQSGAAPYIFNTATDNESMAFSTPFAVSTVPTTVQVCGQGGSYLYNTIGITLYKLGDIPE